MSMLSRWWRGITQARSLRTNRTQANNLAVERLEDRQLLNAAPVLTPLADQTVTVGQGRLIVPFAATDADGDRLRVNFKATKLPSPNYQLDQALQLNYTGSYQ